MRCPYCGFEDTQVKDSRPTEDNAAIRRRRFCSNCNTRFTTTERIHLRDLYVIKKSGVKKPFDQDKITRAIKTALRKRAVSEGEIERLVSKIVAEFESHGDGEIPSSVIGEKILKELSFLDPVAHIRFASVYMDFNTAEDFEKFIQTINNNHEVRKTP
jgi:transcriptional repressor NrdR